MEGAVFDVDFNLDVAEATEGEAEEVVVGVLDIVAVEAGELAVADFNDGVRSKGVLGELQVVVSGGTSDGEAEALEVAVGYLSELQAADGRARHGTLGEEELDVGVVADMLVGYVLVHARDEEHAGDEVAVDHALGAVGINMQHFLAGDVGFPGGSSGGFAEEGDTGVGVLLVGQQDHEPLAVGYGRATRFVHVSTYRSAWRTLCFVHISLQRYKSFFNYLHYDEYFWDKTLIFHKKGEIAGEKARKAR